MSTELSAFGRGVPLTVTRIQTGDDIDVWGEAIRVGSRQLNDPSAPDPRMYIGVASWESVSWAGFTAEDEPESDADLDWLGENLLELRDRYGGLWVAIDKQQVVATGSTVEEMEAAIDEAGVEAPLVTFIAEEEPDWLTAYGQ